MFRLRTFGGLWLERDQQRIVGVSPRRLGLLAAVVAAGDSGISRDRLLLLLWPDSTETKARHALAQTLYSLRRELGYDLIQSEPVDLLVNPAQLSSDLTEFLDARNRGDHDRAAELYAGPFLDGFYVPEADEFERWAEVERSRLREAAIQALEGAARRAAGAGRHEAALDHWRRLCVLAPHNSRVALGYMTSLADGGDVAGAIQYGRTHELARRREVGAQPDPSITALLTRLTSGPWHPSATTAAAEAATSGVAASVTAPAPVSAEVQPAGRPGAVRSPLGWAIGAGALVVALLALWLLPSVLSGPAPFPAGSVVVMADPIDLSGEPGLGRALASAAAVGLQQSQHLTLLSRQRIADALRRMGRSGDSVLTDSLAVEVAARENARAVLGLTVARVGGEYVLTGHLSSPRDGADLAVHQESAHGLDAVVQALDRVIRAMLATAGDSRSYRDSIPPLPQVTTRSLEALKLYAEGAQLWNRAGYDQARQLFERAVAVDSGFALAHAALGSYHYLMNHRPEGDVHLAAAQRLRDRLTFREQLTLDSRMAGVRGDYGEQGRIGKIMAERFPSRDTWYDYGSSMMRQGRCLEALPALRKALSFDSTIPSTHINIATCHRIMGDNRLALDEYAAAERLDSTALTTSNINHEWGEVFVRLGRYAEAEAAFRRMLAKPDRNDQARGHRSLAYLDMLRGRYRAAIDHLTTAVIHSRATGAVTSLVRNEALLAEAYLVRGSGALAGRELDEALKVAGAQYVEPGFLALLGRVLVRANRLRDARAVLARIEGEVRRGNPTDRSARGLLVAELALARGDAPAAFEAIRSDIDPILSEWRSAVLGRALAGRGVLDSALVVTAQFSRSEGFGWDTQTEWVLAPLEIARIAEALGDSATARAALQALLDRWQNADPDLRILADVRSTLLRLQRGANR